MHKKSHHTQRSLDTFMLIPIALSSMLEIIVVRSYDIMYDKMCAATLHVLTLGFTFKKFKSENNEFLPGEFLFQK